MSIRVLKGNVISSKSDILVNTVNCEGVMGTGVALHFRNTFPSMYKRYKEDCKIGLYQAGHIREYLHSSGRIILNFATKDTWMNSSRIEWIESGLCELHTYLNGTTYSIAIPALGCGNGGLDWGIVRGMIERKLGGLGNDIELYEPFH